MDGNDSPMLEAALAYAARGWAVFPLAERGKMPATANGCKDATTDEEQIRAWWGGHRPWSNIGIATGAASGGLVAIDLDVDEDAGKDGVSEMQEWERENGRLPETACAVTGRGGEHLLYRVDSPVSCSVNADLGIDVRGEGGYIVAPPSVHPNGNAYHWDLDPDDVPVAMADGTVRAFLAYVQRREPREGGAEVRRERFKLPKSIGRGQRNDTLMRYACSMQARGTDDDVIAAAVEAANSCNCDPPLPAREVRAIVESALSYEKGRPRGAGGAAETRKMLQLDADGRPRQTIDNCVAAMQTDAALKGRFWYDTMQWANCVTLPLPWDGRHGSRLLSDSDRAQLRRYMEREYGLKKAKHIDDAITCVCCEDSRDMLRERLLSLRWDGTKRVGQLFSAFLGARYDGYTAEVERVFFHGGVARALEPGAKFDYCVIFKGPQGIGKSRFAAALAMAPEWFTDSLRIAGTDEAVEKMRGKWIVELGELSSVKRAADVEQVKGFVSATSDTIRPKYAKDTEDRPRRCVFIGTTNSETFLVDGTGNRRFPVIECGVCEPTVGFDAGGIAIIEQAWAEAVDDWRRGALSLVLSDGGRARMEEENSRFEEEDTMVGIVGRYLDAVLHDPLRCDKRVCIAELYERALDFEKSRYAGNRRMANDMVAAVAKAGGWHRAERPARLPSFGMQKFFEPDGCTCEGVLPGRFGQIVENIVEKIVEN